MLKKIRIAIKTTKRPLSGSLFEENSTPKAKKEAPETTKLMMEGNWRDDGNRIYLTYREGELSGMGQTTTILSFDKREPNLITLTRSGAVRTAMIFEKGARHLSVYETPLMSFDLAIFTKSVQNTLMENNGLHLLYTVELKGATPEENDFSLTVLPYFEKPQGQ